MATIKIDNFGGVIPRMLPETLPVGSAQTNENLLATSIEFRPMQEATAVAAAPYGAKSLYRTQKQQVAGGALPGAGGGLLHTNETQGWVALPGEHSYVRVALNDDPKENTIISRDAEQYPLMIWNNAGRLQRLGVPAPEKAEVLALKTERFTASDARNWVTATLVPRLIEIVGEVTSEDQFSARFTDVDGNKMLVGGIYGRSTAGITRLDPNQYLGPNPGVYQYFPKGIPEGDPRSQRGLNEPWNLLIRIPSAAVTSDGMGNPELGGIAAYDPADGDTPTWLGIAAFPLWGQVDSAALVQKMLTVTHPLTTNELVWPDHRVHLAAYRLTQLLSADREEVTQQRAEIDKAVADFSLAGFEALSNIKPIAPAGTFEFSVGGGTSQESTSTASDAQTAAYEQNLADWKAQQAACVSRMLDAQTRAAKASHEIERLYNKVKSEMRSAMESYLLGEYLVRTDLNPDGLVSVDPDVNAETRFYVTTFVSAYGEESAPSPVSEGVEVYPGSDLVVVKQPAIPSVLTGTTLEKWRVYRTNSGSASTAFQFVGERTLGEIHGGIANDVGSTNSDIPGVETTHRWRDIVANWQILANYRGINSYDLKTYQDTALLRVGDRATQSDWRAGQTYSVTKTWNGSAWIMENVADVSGYQTQPVFIDGKYGSLLGEVCPTITWAEPPVVDGYHLQGIVGLDNGIVAGFIDNFVAFSEAYTPYAWPVEYQVTVPYPIVGLCAVGNSVLVGTRGVPYIIDGSDPSTMTARTLEAYQPCVSRRSMVAVQGGVMYASPDGYVLASTQGVVNVTEGLFAREDWTALDPASIFAVVHDNVLYFWFTGNGGGCYGLDMTAKKLTTHVQGATAAFADVVSDGVYVAHNGQVHRLFASGRRTGRWKSGKLVTPAQAPLAWGKVYADYTYPVTLKWYGDGVLRHTKEVLDGEPFRLPPGRYLSHEVEVISKGRVWRVVLASTTDELKVV